VLLLVIGIFLLNNLAPYLGLQYSGAITMFSNLSATGDNHLLMPKISLSDADDYVSVERLDSSVQTARFRQFKAFVDWTKRRDVLINLNFLRYHLNRLCGEERDRAVSVQIVGQGGSRAVHENACDEPSLQGYFGLSSYDECDPECENYLRQWARGEIPAR